MFCCAKKIKKNLGILHINPKVVYTFFEAIPENGPFVEESVNWKIKDAKICHAFWNM